MRTCETRGVPPGGTRCETRRRAEPSERPPSTRAADMQTKAGGKRARANRRRIDVDTEQKGTGRERKGKGKGERAAAKQESCREGTRDGLTINVSPIAIFTSACNRFANCFHATRATRSTTFKFNLDGRHIESPVLSRCELPSSHVVTGENLARLGGPAQA
jgi:hypothetical protein